MSDRIQSLCDHAKEGDTRAAAELVTLHYERIYAYLRRLCGSDDDQTLAWLRKDNEELNRLREEITRLRAQLPELERLRMENQQLASGNPAAARPEGNEEFFARVPGMMDAAKNKLKSVACVRNLQQIGNAARVWAASHRDFLGPSFAAMGKELATPGILVCPGDSTRAAARNFEEFSAANATYEMLSPGVSETEPEVVYVRCPVHGHVLMVDGSLRQGGPGREVEFKNGKWLFKQPVGVIQ